LFYFILKCFVKKKDVKKKNTKMFENKMFMKIVRPCWSVNMRSSVGCKILHKVTLNKEKNKGNIFNLVFFNCCNECSQYGSGDWPKLKRKRMLCKSQDCSLNICDNQCKVLVTSILACCLRNLHFQSPEFWFVLEVLNALF
jgi:hypothetical protein